MIHKPHPHVLAARAAIQRAEAELAHIAEWEAKLAIKKAEAQNALEIARKMYLKAQVMTEPIGYVCPSCQQFIKESRGIREICPACVEAKDPDYGKFVYFGGHRHASRPDAIIGCWNKNPDLPTFIVGDLMPLPGKSYIDCPVCFPGREVK